MTQNEQVFVKAVWEYFNHHSRQMPWREPEKDGTYDPYKILVSELMLQQTQVDRVIPKYNDFIKAFPNCKKLAASSLGDVLTLWSGLGYNRRAKYLHDIAKQLAGNPFPRTKEELSSLKGIGENTAAAILTYSFNESHVFIETNVRTVLIHHFYPDEEAVDDKELRSLLQKTLDTQNPREFMWALMDYGTYLKKQGVKTHTKSKHYAKQTAFNGSTRQLRGEVLRRAQKNSLVFELHEKLNDSRLDSVIKSLAKEGLILVADGRIVLP